MSDYRRKGNFSATRMPVAGRLEDGTQFKAGDYLVVDESGVQRVLSETQFKAEFEPTAPQGGHAIAVREDDRRRYMAPVDPRHGQYAPAAPVFGPSGEQLPMIPGGARAVGGLLREAMDPNVFLPALADSVTGKLIRPAMNVETGRRPTITNVRLDKDGNVISVDMKPEEWPPRGETFGG